ncbi:MAG: LptF/LptG family permease [Candidatus Bipolaricaulia bacterium]
MTKRFIIDRYIFFQLIPPFLFGIGLFAVFLSIDPLRWSINYIFDRGAPVGVVMQHFLYTLPSLMVFTFPMSTLLAVLLVFGNLSANHEIIAMRAGGLSFHRLTIPLIVFGVLASILTFTFSDWIVPAANEQANRILYEGVLNRPIPQVQRDIFYSQKEDGKLKLLFYAARFDGRRMMLNDVNIQEFEEGKLRQIVTASRAIWNASEHRWYIEDGAINRIGEEGRANLFVRFDRRAVSIKAPQELALSRGDPEKMSTSQLRHYIQVRQESGHPVTQLWVIYHLKFAIPFAALIFVLLGAPVAVRPARASKALSFGLSLVIIFAYYIVLSFSQVFGQRGYLPPPLSAWMQNLLFGALAVAFLWWANKRAV